MYSHYPVLRKSVVLLLLLSSNYFAAATSSYAQDPASLTSIVQNNNIPKSELVSSSSIDGASTAFDSVDVDVVPSVSSPITTTTPSPFTLASRSANDNCEQINNDLHHFLLDMKNIQSLPITKLTTPCHLICRDTSNTKAWTLEDWDRREF